MLKFLSRPFTTHRSFCGQFPVLCPAVRTQTSGTNWGSGVFYKMDWNLSLRPEKYINPFTSNLVGLSTVVLPIQPRNYHETSALATDMADPGLPDVHEVPCRATIAHPRWPKRFDRSKPTNWWRKACIRLRHRKPSTSNSFGQGVKASLHNTEKNMKAAVKIGGAIFAGFMIYWGFKAIFTH